MTSVKTERWNRLKRILSWLPVALLGMVLVASLVYVFWKAIKVDNLRPMVPDEAISQALGDATEVIAAGCAVDSVGRAISGAHITLSAYTVDGQPVWTANSQTNVVLPPDQKASRTSPKQAVFKPLLGKRSRY